MSFICYIIKKQNKLKGDNVKEESYFNPGTYMVIDRVTGEEINVSIFIEKASVNGWQKAFAKTLSEYIKCGDGKSVDLLAHIIENKDSRTNLIHGTQRELAEKSKVSLAVVSRTLKALSDKELIKKVRSGCYMVSPDVMRNGSTKVGSMIFRLWGDIDSKGVMK